ncbi:DUF2529 domain-containing protein [Alkalihalobacillus sp. MEB130]|uniref:DUF2529 family protein n=1 Tax=Alkalihalobacillus sp. MEB130 TaxID=2976704 RepID=UPI0028DF3533|nr:DUF2529 family protein [Alkalihalobacillus sp. MEB130]MDT8860463.1 DUF2529 domain-containing protein [Alkalihalobacillus sp. MEB130]
MQKIFKTQLIGLLNNTLDEDMLEDAARLLSQALVGDGHIYIHGTGEMAAVCAEALHGKETLARVSPLIEEGSIVTLDPADRVFLLARSSSDPEMIGIAKQLSKQHIFTVGLSATVDTDGSEHWVESVDIHLDLALSHSLVPTDTGERIGYPASLMALYTYFCLFLLISEILSEYEEE